MMSKKGVESFPFFLFLSLLVAAFVIVIGFSQLHILDDVSGKKKLTDSYNTLISQMENLRTSSDEGSFTHIRITIPKGVNLSFNATDDTIKIVGDGLNLTNHPHFNIIAITDKYGQPKKSLTLQKGEYILVIYYGNQTKKPEPYELFFK
jgi:hypothetical protein